MVELNRSPFRGKGPSNPIKENLGTIITAIAIILCILVSFRMQKGSAPQRMQAQDGVVLDMAPTRSQGSVRRGADPVPQKRSSLEVRPIWGNLPGNESLEAKEVPEKEPEPEPEPEPEMPAPAPAFQAPDLSELMKGVKAEVAAPRMKKSEFGASTKGGRSGGGGGGFKRVTSFEDKERAERAKKEKERKAAGPPIGGYNDPKNIAAMNRLKQAIERGGAPESLQKFGLDLPKLYQLQAAGANVEQFVTPDGTLNISDDDASAMAGRLGIGNMGPDQATSDSSIRGGR